MGGRRSKSIRHIFGGGLKNEQAKLTRAIKKGKKEDIAESTINLVSKSKTSYDYLSKATKFIDLVVRKISEKELKPTTFEEGKKIATFLWTTIKKEQGIEVPKEVDEIIVSAAADLLVGGKND